MARAGARLIEAAPITIEAVALAHEREAVLIDLAASCRCTCARDRAAASRLEPPRSASAVVVNPGISLTDENTFAPADTQAEVQPPRLDTSGADRRATFAEHGLSTGEANPLPPADPSFASAREPW